MSENETQPTISSDNNSAERREQVRYSGGSRSLNIPIVVQWETAGEMKSSSGRLQDLSQTGICLKLDSPITLSKTIELRLCVADSDFDLTLASEVCWVRGYSAVEWLVGCSFEQPLPEEMLSSLALDGVINRRVEKRRDTGLTGFARQELSGDAVNVRVEDYSTGGFRLFMPTPLNIGERLMLLLEAGEEGPLSVPARSVWQLEQADGCYAGCQFINPTGYSNLSRAIQFKADGAMSVAELTGPWADYKLLTRQLWNQMRGWFRQPLARQ